MREPIRIEIPTPFPVGPVNCYLFLEPEPTLVDCPVKTPDAIAALEAELADWELAIGDLRHVYVTHAHVDHMGLVGTICERSEATIHVNPYCFGWATDLERESEKRADFIVEVARKGGLSAEAIRRLHRMFSSMTTMWDNVPTQRVRVFQPDEIVEIGGLPWEVLYLPGHAVMQTGFYQAEQKWLLSADCLLHLTPVPVIERDLNNPAQRIRGLPIHLDSLARLEALEIESAYPGHGKVITDHRQLIAKQIERIHFRKEQCFDLIKEGRQTLSQMTEIMYSHYPPEARFTGLSMILGYVDLLSAENRITCREVAGVWHYFPK